MQRLRAGIYDHVNLVPYTNYSHTVLAEGIIPYGPTPCLWIKLIHVARANFARIAILGRDLMPREKAMCLENCYSPAKPCKTCVCHGFCGTWANTAASANYRGIACVTIHGPKISSDTII
ncbi:hypothetical protein ABVK25_011808 [Lepraria finkii]|uniref:Uncharacterized protein n=1 Tax=Lepraria finkii TaxID=1340010 RepID=A0ABR4ALW7_9LECA